MEKSTIFELSDRFPEPLKLLYRLKFIFLATLISTKIAADSGLLQGEKMLPTYLAVASIYIAGRIADVFSSLKIIELLDKANSLGIDVNDIKETNPHLPGKPTANQMINKGMEVTAAGIIPCLIIPQVGFIVGLGSLYPVIHHYRLAKKINSRISNVKK